MPDFNCQVKVVMHTALDLAVVGEKNVNSTRFIGVPYITNIRDVLAGEELIMRQVHRAKPKKEAKRVWQDVQREEEKKGEKQAASTKKQKK